MPLVQHKAIANGGEIGLWQIEEAESWFRDRLFLYPEELRQLSAIKGRNRRREWLAARHLVHLMSGRKRRGAFLKDKFGKPSLADSDWHISISHTTNYAAAIAAPYPVGIDIQTPVSKITRLAHKFLREEEAAVIQEPNRIDHLHLFWGAKEALYKVYGRRQLDFCTHIMVEPTVYPPPQGQLWGRIHKDNWQQNYHLFFEVWEGMYMIYASG